MPFVSQCIGAPAVAEIQRADPHARRRALMLYTRLPRILPCFTSSMPHSSNAAPIKLQIFPPHSAVRIHDRCSYRRMRQPRPKPLTPRNPVHPGLYRHDLAPIDRIIFMDISAFGIDLKYHSDAFRVSIFHALRYTVQGLDISLILSPQSPMVRNTRDLFLHGA